MLATIEIDVLLHLGKFLNVDLLERGAYLLEVALLYGVEKRRISPIGLFCSPSHLDSHVGEVRIQGGGMLSPCEVDEVNHLFRSRSLIIKYKGEKHELNEGVQWRIHLPAYELNKDAPICPDLLFIQFGLIHQNMEESEVLQEKGEGKIVYNITGEREIVSVQVIGLQAVGSGFHQYFPVNFDGNYCVNLDTMIHTCVSAITFHDLPQLVSNILKPPTIENQTDSGSKMHSSGRRGSRVEAVPPQNSPPPPPTKRSSTIIEKPIFDPNGSLFDGNYISFSAVMNKFTRRSSRASKTDDKQPSKSFHENSANSTASSDTLATEESANIVQLELVDYNSLHPLSSISEKQWKKIIFVIFLPILKNYEIAMEHSQFILDLYEDWKESTDLGASEHPNHATTPEHKHQTKENIMIQKKRIISQILAKFHHFYQHIHSSISSASSSLSNSSESSFNSFTDVVLYLEKELNELNHRLSLHWSVLFNSCRKVMKFIRNILFIQYSDEINAFWKQQMMLHTRSFEGSDKMTSRKDVITLSMLEDHIEIERTNDQDLQLSLQSTSSLMVSSKVQQIILSSPNTSVYHHSSSSSAEDFEAFFNEEDDGTHRKDVIGVDDINLSTASMVGPKILARGMKVFDVNVHMYPSKTAYLFMEKYIADQQNDQNRIERSLSNLEDKLFDEFTLKPPTPSAITETEEKRNNKYTHQPSHFTGKHLVILQHGFLGSGYDMRLFAQTVKILCPGNVHVYTAIANERCSQDSISTMGKNLRNEIINLIHDKHPEFLEEEFQRDDLRISFIAHSMGGLIVRSALQEKELHFLRNKLHIFLSLAVPHLGSSFPESSLVSTGMWALSKFKNCVCLKELNLDDLKEKGSGKDKEKEMKNKFLYKLSEESCMNQFTKIILISSPKDQYVPFYSARLQITPRIEQSPEGKVIQQMIDNLLQVLNPDQLIRITLVNNINYNINAMQQAIQEYSIFNNLIAGGKGGKSGTNTSNGYNPLFMLPGSVGSGGSTGVSVVGASSGSGSGGSFDINNMIGRTAHICYLENPAIAFQIIQSILPYFSYDYYPH